MLDQDAPLAGATIGDVTGRTWDAAAILDKLDLGGRLDDPTATLSGGEAKRVGLARTLVEVGPPGEAGDDVLLILDEPTNHLDIDAITWLEERLAMHRGGLVLVSHDRHVLDRVTTRILELDRGRGYVHEGGYAGYLEARAEPRGAGGQPGAHPPEPGALRARLAAPGRPGAHEQAEGAHRVGDGDRRGSPGGRRARWRPRPRVRSAAPRRQHDRAARCRSPVLRRTVVVPRRRAVARSTRAARHRRAERRREIDLARRHRRHARAGRGHSRGGRDRRASVRSPSAGSTSTPRCASIRRSPGRPGSPTGRTPDSSNGSGSTPTPNGRRSACCRAVSAGACSSS